MVRLFLGVSIFLCCFVSSANSEQLIDLRNNTLIIYNENATDAEEIAQYYANARSIPNSQICGVKLPAGLYASKAQLLGARKTIVNCICSAMGNSAPRPCSVNNLESVAEKSPISHLAIIRGLPARLTETGFPGDAEEPSLDFYLAHLIYKPTDLIFGPDKHGSIGSLPNYSFPPIQATVALESVLDPIEPAVDRHVVYGRIEASTKEKTFSLIDRTLSAESTGFQGNILIEKTEDARESSTISLARDTVGARSEACVNYLYSGGNWPHDECKVGVTRDGSVPGTTDSTVPVALNSGFLAGAKPYGNTQRAFNSAETVSNWHKSEYECVEHCLDLGSAEAILSCQERSLDGVLNPDCVGVAPGAIGIQIRSYPVQYYGFYPKGWFKETSGAVEALPPTVIDSGAAFKNEVFLDNSFIRLGGASNSPAPTCTLENGDEISCSERVPVSLFSRQTLSNVIDYSEIDLTFNIRIRHSTNPQGAELKTKVIFKSPVSVYCDRISTNTHAAEATTRGWNTLSHTVQSYSSLPVRNSSRCTDHSPFNIDSTEVGIVARFSEKLYGSLDVDGAELINNRTSENLIPNNIGSFNSAPYVAHTAGDWAAHAIDRLGFISWAGSSSHFLTAGWAFSNIKAIMSALFSGRSLGESWYIGGSQMSGIIYGDPLYSPSAAKLYVNDGSWSSYAAYLGNDPDRYKALTVSPLFPETMEAKFYANIFHGRDNTERTIWQIARCDNLTPIDCDQLGAWQQLTSQTQVGMRLELPLPKFSELFSEINSEMTSTFRLTVYNPGEEDSALHSYAHLHFVPDPNINFLVKNLKALSDTYSYGVQDVIRHTGGFDAAQPKLVNIARTTGMEIALKNASLAELLEVSVEGVLVDNYDIQKSFSGDRVQINFTEPITKTDSLRLKLSINGFDYFMVVNILPGDVVEPFLRIDQNDFAELSDILSRSQPGIRNPLNNKFDFDQDHVFDQQDIDFLINSTRDSIKRVTPVKKVWKYWLQNF